MLYAVQSDKVPTLPAISKEWQAKVTYRECGVVTDIRTYAVTLERTPDTESGYTATVDGVIVDVLDAARILENAQSDNGLTLTREVRPMLPSMKACLGVSA